jgi:2-succinyl-5-enolpyruvyl-6-hydroxy-3-cyclohexene-1-carboxylate synthase
MVPGSGGDDGVQAAFAATLVDEWARGGVTHAVVCPGSRSTPLVIALAARPDIELHVRLDERSAGFTALGIGKADGRPALVVTTSGTAAVELHPAVVEADLAGVAMIVCTADRPPELRDVGAPQTIDQTHLFGRAVRWFADPGVPALVARSSWRSLASRAVGESTGGPSGPGPVHLNFPFREPLLGDAAAGGGVVPGRSGGVPWHRVATGAVPPPPGTVASLVEEGVLSPRRRGVIVAGADGGDADAVAVLAEALGWPVLADPRSGLRDLHPNVIGTADLLLQSSRFAREHRPEVVLQFGDRWVSKVVTGQLSAAVDAGATAVVVDPWARWGDPGREVGTFVRSDPSLFCEEAARGVGATGTGAGATAHDGWLASWRGSEARARSVVGSMMDGGGEGAPPGGGPIDEPTLAHRLWSRLPGDATLVVSSSMPVRDVEAYGLPRGRPPRVLANRGANGIDGVVSTALGVALATGGPTVALVGDLAFLHDVSALVRTPDLDAHLVVVVADNAGGGIFSFLPPAGSLDHASFERLFGTPQTADPAEVAAGFGWPVDALGAHSSSAAFDAALGTRLRERGMSVISVRVPDRRQNVVVHDRISEAVVAAIDDGDPGVDDA